MKRTKFRKPIKKRSAATLPVKDKKPSKQLERQQFISRNLTLQPYIKYRERAREIAFEAQAQVDRIIDKFDPRLMEAIRYYDRLLFEQRHTKSTLDALRDTYKYHLKRGNRILRIGITNDLDGREREHQRKYGDDVHLQQVGRRTTRPAAMDWENDQQKALHKPLRPVFTVFTVMIGTFLIIAGF